MPTICIIRRLIAFTIRMNINKTHAANQATGLTVSADRSLMRSCDGGGQGLVEEMVAVGGRQHACFLAATSRHAVFDLSIDRLRAVFCSFGLTWSISRITAAS